MGAGPHAHLQSRALALRRSRLTSCYVQTLNVDHSRVGGKHGGHGHQQSRDEKRTRCRSDVELYSSGLRVVATLGGMIGYVTCGCSPVNDLRNAVIFETCSSLSDLPSWSVAMIPTA